MLVKMNDNLILIQFFYQYTFKIISLITTSLVGAKTRVVKRTKSKQTRIILTGSMFEKTISNELLAGRVTSQTQTTHIFYNKYMQHLELENVRAWLVMLRNRFLRNFS